MGIFKKKRKETEYIEDPFFEEQEESSVVLSYSDDDTITPWEERNITARHALTPEEVMADNKHFENSPDFQKTDETESLFAKIAKNSCSGEFTFGDNIDNKEKETLSENDIKMHIYKEKSDEVADEIAVHSDISEPERPNSLKPTTQIEKIPLYKQIDNDDINEIIDSDTTKGEVESLLDKCKSFIYDESTLKEESFFKEPEPLYTLESVESIISSVDSKKLDLDEDEYIAEVNVGNDTDDFHDISSNTDENDYFKSFEVQLRKETPEENSKKMHHYVSIGDDTEDSINEAKKIPVNIKMLDRTDSEPIMIAVKDNLDLGATQVIPDIKSRTEVSLNSNDIQMSLADSDIVTEQENDGSISPEHALFTKKSSIKKELLDDFFDAPEDVEALKPKYSNIISDSRFDSILKGVAFKKSVETAKRVADIENSDDDSEFATRDFSLSEATAEFNKFEEQSVVEISDEDVENEPAARFNTPENLKGLSEKLKNSFRILKIKLLPTAIITLILIGVSLFIPQTATTTLICASLLLTLCAINYDVIMHIVSVFSLNHGIDTPVSLSCILVMLQTILCGFVFKTEYINLTPIAALALCFNILGKMFMFVRVIKNISLIDNTDEKNVLKFIDNESFINSVSKDFIEGDVLIATKKPTVNLNGFAALSFESSIFEKILSNISVFSIIAAVVCATSAYIFDLNISEIISSFVIGICACYPPAALFIINLPLNGAGRKLQKQKCAFAGYAGAAEVEKCNAITVNAKDLFPKGTIKLNKMYVLSENKVDETFEYAAAVAFAADSPLAPMLQSVLNNPQSDVVAEDINYEDKMGISGWIKDKRVLIGNRLLMEGHSVAIPQSNIDKKILKMGYFPVYIAFDSKPCLLLICSYSIDDEVAYNLRSVCNLGISVFISSNDPNITDEMVTDYFGLYEDSVKTLSLSNVDTLQKEAEFTEDSVSPVLFGKNINGFLKVFSICNKIKSTAFVMLTAHIVLIALAILGVIYFIATGRFAELNTIKALGFSVITIVVTYLSYLIKKV